VFAPGQAIESSLKQLAERRTDIFGVGQFLSSVVFFSTSLSGVPFQHCFDRVSFWQFSGSVTFCMDPDPRIRACD
jgi:hypothetical protein